MTEPRKNLTILHFRAENVKRLQVVDFEPDPNVVVVSGDNGGGKSSCLDSILYALGGKGALPSEPIRRGAERAEITLDLGEFVVTRKITRKGEYLDIRSPDGATRYTSPQALLDGLMDAVAFDPAAWLRRSPREQRSELLALAGIDPDENRAAHRALYDERTMIGRDLKRVEGALAALGPVPEVPAGPDRAEALAAYEEAQGEARRVEAVRAAHQRRKDLVEQATIKMESFREDAERERQRLQRALTDHQLRAESKLRQLQAALDEAVQREIDGREVPEAPDLARFRAAVEAADAVERARRQIERIEEAQEEVEAVRGQRDALTERIAALNADLFRMLHEADFPVEGLGVSEEEVLFNDLPLSQASQAEQLRVALSVAIHLQERKEKRLAVIRIMDGSLLDDNSMRLVRQVAEAHSAQVWIERIERDGASVVIEDGIIAGRPEGGSATDARRRCR